MSASRVPDARVLTRTDKSKNPPVKFEVVDVSRVEMLPVSPLTGEHGLVRAACEASCSLLYIHEYLLKAEHLVLDPTKFGWASYLLVTSLVADNMFWLDVLVALWSERIEPFRDDWRYPMFAGMNGSKAPERVLF